ncbi:hypothetical protein [Streptomyces sp. NPDC001307]|uniref:hypothetical protein n=1 Tax=Streptomyces sp. NPDC001307 TaxID=3364560 RepID=UPI0036CF8AA5
MLSLTDTGRRAGERDMAERNAWPAGALGSLGETEHGVPAPAAGPMERLRSLETGGEGEHRCGRRALACSAGDGDPRPERGGQRAFSARLAARCR